MTYAIGAEIKVGKRSLAGFRLHATMQVVVVPLHTLTFLAQFAAQSTRP